MPIVLHSQLELPFLSSVPHWMMFLLFIFVTDHLQDDYREQKLNITVIPALTGILVPVITTLFMLTTLHTDRVLSRFERNPQVDIRSLGEISNPIVWQDRIDWDLNFGQLALGLYTGRMDLIAPYIKWAPELVKRKPRGMYYQYLVVAYRAIGNDIMAERIRAEAEYLLPEYSFNYSVTGLDELDNWYPSAARGNPVID